MAYIAFFYTNIKYNCTSRTFLFLIYMDTAVVYYTIILYYSQIKRSFNLILITLICDHFLWCELILPQC